ncbi:MAG TPA: hypothetical protein PLP30_11030 [Clostridia bacterium]|nr:hypothetical protein [Clostridia bacterium]HRX42010.1 hypothetical protein [Clostridia bacterium]
MLRKKTAVLFALMLATAMIFSACSQSAMFEEEANNTTDRQNAIETSYTIEEITEEYAGVVYTIPRVEGMTNKSKQADINGHMKRAALKATADNNGERGPVSDSYEVMIMNDYIFSVRFVTTLDVDIPNRGVTLLVRDYKFLFSLENLFGKAEDNPAFADMRAVLEEAGVSSSFTDDELRKQTIYFEGEDMQNLILHVTFFSDQNEDVSVPFADVIEYLTDEMSESFDFAR